MFRMFVVAYGSHPQIVERISIEVLSPFVDNISLLFCHTYQLHDAGEVITFFYNLSFDFTETFFYHMHYMNQGFPYTFLIYFLQKFGTVISIVSLLQSNKISELKKIFHCCNSKKKIFNCRQNFRSLRIKKFHMTITM